MKRITLLLVIIFFMSHLITGMDFSKQPVFDVRWLAYGNENNQKAISRFAEGTFSVKLSQSCFPELIQEIHSREKIKSSHARALPVFKSIKSIGKASQNKPAAKSISKGSILKNSTKSKTAGLNKSTVKTKLGNAKNSVKMVKSILNNIFKGGKTPSWIQPGTVNGIKTGKINVPGSKGGNNGINNPGNNKPVITQIYNTNGIQINRVDDGNGNLSITVIKGSDFQSLPYVDGQSININFSDGTSCVVVVSGSSATVFSTTGNTNSVNNANNGTQNGTSGTLHLIMFGDTLDPSIGVGVICCQRDMEALFTDAANQAGLSIQKYLFRGQDFTIENLESVLQSLTCGPDDAIVFYYDGHGFRYDNQTEKWNYLSVGPLNSSNAEYRRTGKSSYDIYQSLQAKGARLTLVFADCCNNTIGLNRSRIPRQNAVFMRAFSSQEQCTRLFAKAVGSGIITSSSPGEIAYGSDYDSRFSVGCSNSFRDEISSSNPNLAEWDSIFSNTTNAVIQAAANQGKGFQTPIYETNLSYNP